MTQQELEGLFDLTDRKEALAEVYALTSLDLPEHKFNELAKLMNISDDNLDAVLIAVVSIVLDSTNGTKVYEINDSGRRCLKSHPEAEYYGVREVTLQAMITSMMGIGALRKAYNDYEAHVSAVKELVFYLCGEFYDFEPRGRLHIPLTKEWRTVPIITLRSELSPVLAQKLRYAYHRPPMVELPNAWKPKSNGGYFAGDKPVIKGKFSTPQTERALMALNRLQRMAWVLNPYTSAAEEKEFVRKSCNFEVSKSPKLLNFDTVEDMIENRTSHLQEVRGMMATEKEFFFEWRADFRGRMYPTGYDLNPQGDKYKKGAICASCL